MLIRRRLVDPNNIKAGCNRQEVLPDPWEDTSCLEVIGIAFSIGPINQYSWTSIAAGQVSLGQEFVHIPTGTHEAGYLYYRRPIDIQREEIWRNNPHFTVTSVEWWDTDELNKWWKNRLLARKARA